jgi:hypothetical protein
MELGLHFKDVFTILTFNEETFFSIIKALITQSMIEKNNNLSAEEILETLYAARDVCIRYEKKYDMLSEQFYELYSQGLLDDDGLNFDLVDWAGSYKTVLDCQRAYNGRVQEFSVAEKLAHLRAHAMVA